jgi:DNA polymerase III subunit gamma/tau
MVMVARSGGADTVASQRKQARQTAEREVRDLPDVQAILKAFPGAEIIKVRDAVVFTAPDNTAIEATTEDSE